MFKKFIFLVLALPFMVSQSCAVWEDLSIHDGKGTSKTLRAVWRNDQGRVILTSAPLESFDYYAKTLHNLPIKAAYPSPEGAATTFKGQNIDRQTAGNLFHLFKVSFQPNNKKFSIRLGFVQLGRIPSKGYAEGIEGHSTAHHPIIKKPMTLGLTEKINPGGGLEDSNIKRISNRGMAIILPLFKNDASETESFRVYAIEACYNLVYELTRRQALLPIEKTCPYAVGSLFHPKDPNIERFAKNGFDVDEDEGFGWFYPASPVTLKRKRLEALLSHWEQTLEQLKKSKGKKRTVRSRKEHAHNMITSLQAEIEPLKRFQELQVKIAKGDMPSPLLQKKVAALKKLEKGLQVPTAPIPQPRTMVTRLIGSLPSEKKESLSLEIKE